MHDLNASTKPRLKLRGVTPFDFAVIVPIVALSLFLVLWPRIGREGNAASGNTVVLYQEGERALHLSLDRAQEVSFLEGKMLLEIKDHAVRIIRSDCPRQFCVHQGWARLAGEKIVCVPFKTMIEIHAQGKPAVDAVVY